MKRLDKLELVCKLMGHSFNKDPAGALADKRGIKAIKKVVLSLGESQTPPLLVKDIRSIPLDKHSFDSLD